MLLKFTKMHGAGNDFVVIDLISQRYRPQEQDILLLADRHFGIGCDQVLLVEAPDSPDVDFRYRIFNADGSEVENCGNGARCFARFVRDKQLTGKRVIRVQTAGGVLELRVRDKHQVEVDMGVPVLAPTAIPFMASQQADHYALIIEDRQLEIGALSMGNPHAVLRVDDVDRAPVATLGPIIECHPNFPQRVNVGFMQVMSATEIRLRVFERGAGETLACGTGACAAAVYGMLRGWLQ
ncbi:MAG: diaminopimelate epimerase, partial [Haliea sp.]